MLQPSTLKFLKSLAKNNNKPWFDAHRDEYLEAKKDFENFVSKIIKETAKFDADIKDLQIKDCVFRINRDIRFSKNKTSFISSLQYLEMLRIIRMHCDWLKFQASFIRV